MLLSGIAVGLTAIAGAGASGLKMVSPSARSVSRVATVEKWKVTMMSAGLSANGPSAGLAATARWDAVNPHAPCMGTLGRVAQPPGLSVPVLNNAVLIVA